MSTGVLESHGQHGPGGAPHVEALPDAIGGSHTLGSVVDSIGDIATCVKPHPRQWYIAFAAMCAGVFPLLHMGRPWLAYWLFPFPNNFGMWPQFRSPLAWDVFAVSTYFTVSVVFWYVGLIPDFAVLRESAPSKIQKWAYG